MTENTAPLESGAAGVWGEAGSGATARSNGAVFSFREFPGPIGPWELTNRKYCVVDVK